MALDEQVRADLATALKAKDLARANTLRMLLAAFKNAEIEKRSALSEEERLAQVQKAIKIRKEAIEGAVKANRADVKAAEESEMKILQAYLPAQLSDADLADLVAKAIEEAGAKTPAEMGKVMKILMPRIAGRGDGGKASALVKQKLAGA
ncbi:MAG: GatB/YqeY domain-containing protein [Candidatus Coatesbacteria bacterium]